MPRLVALDLETTGLSIPDCEILQIGAVVFENTTGEIINTFKRTIHRTYVTGEAYALAMNKEILEKSLEKKEDVSLAYVAFKDFKDFIYYYAGTLPTPVGMNVAAFDVAFLKEYNVDIFHHRPIELGSLIPKFDGLPSKSSDLTKEILGKDDLDHDALEDALDSYRIYMYWYDNIRVIR